MSLEIAASRKLNLDFTKGLTNSEGERRLKQYGPNVLKAEAKESQVKKFFNQFKSPVIITLLIATFVSFLLGEYVDSAAIIVIVLINAIIGYLQEARAEAAVEALKKLSAPRARVMRDGNVLEILASIVCPGDILVLEAGDYVAADGRILQANQLSADESILTGESLPVNKIIDNKIFAGTVVTTGTARAEVTATGMNTEMGHIARMLEGTKLTQTPLQARLEKVSNRLLVFCGIIVIIVAGLGLIHGESWLNVFMSAISLAVAAIPEGLPTVVTLALALAIRRMTKRNAIVRHLLAVETLGSTNIVCTDKTGTLTTGKMRVREYFNFNGSLKEFVESGVLCSNAAIDDDSGAITGDPTEIALLYFAKDQGINIKNLNDKCPRLAEWSFDSERKRMSVAVNAVDGVIVHVKGAPEAIVPLCNLSNEERNRINKKVEIYSSQGQRTLAIAMSSDRMSSKDFSVTLFKDHSSVEKNLKFLGIVAIADPPRQESIPAIKQCRDAGIKVVMITGDHPMTAKAIATELGIIEEGKFDLVLTGVELDKMTQAELEKRVSHVAVFARVSPEHKLKIVRAWKSNGKIVAMTGDGVNDAPALKEASIGVSMGKGGTEVARQASSMILTDDNFATIVNAIEEGRAIYGNIRRTIQYLLSGNLAEILIMLGAAIAGWPTPLMPIHLLWINLVTDGLPSLALAAEPVPKNLLEQSKSPSPSSFFDRHFYREMIFVGSITAILSLAIYGYSLKTEDAITARTHVFSFLVFAELFRSFACRSDTKTFFQLGFSSNVYHLLAVGFPITFQMMLHHTEFFRNLFKVNEISWGECLVMFLLTLIPVTAVEVRKIW
ncbi:MAG: hypothetical protein A4S09_15210 [Proteobacteria bacterium SG_bin7]|nr:MAG: hypothetical protein A4S09_15210 [Proteobacteria bacterium SG_bin7]